jgi:hypothetical protein
MGIRANVLTTLKTILDGLVIIDEDAPEGIRGSGKVIHVRNSTVDPNELNDKDFPVLCIIPAPHSVQIGINGQSTDSTYRVSLFGFINKAASEELTLAGENAVDVIIDKLITANVFNTMVAAGFSIIEIGPITNESYEPVSNLAYISIPLAIQFSEH